MKQIKTLPPVIFIFVGEFPEYAYDSLEINSNNIDNEIILLCEINKINKLKISNRIKIYDLQDFYFNLTNIKVKKKIEEYRNKFWLKTIERYFILYNFVKYKKIQEFYHAELDNIIGNISNLHTKLNKFHNKFFFTTYKNYGYGSFVYINNLNILNKFCTFSLSKLKKNFSNDMQLLGLFAKYYPSKVLMLPTIDSLYNNNKNMNLLKKIKGLFDDARIGIFLFGHDPQNYCNVVLNRRKYLTDSFSFSNLKKFKFEIKNRNFILLNNNEKIKIYNFHVHSKLIKKIFINKKYKKIIKRSNKNLDTLIYLNLKNIFKLFFLDFRFSRFIRFFKRGL